MYHSIPIPAGKFLAAPSMISVSRDNNILAAIIPLTNGVMLQAFRVTPNGLVDIPVAGQLPRNQANVSISPTGEYIVTHLANAGTPGFSVWRYNSTTESYSRVYQSGNYSAFIGGESVWLNNTVFARYTNSATKTSVAVFGMNGNTAAQIYSVTELDYLGADIFATPDGRNFIVGTQTGNNNNARVYAFESGSVSNTQNLVAGGFQTGDIDSTGTKVLGSRSTSAPALDAYVLSSPGPFAGLTRIAENLSTTADTVRFIYDDIVLRNSPTGVTFHTYDAGVLSPPIPVPDGLEDLSGITSKIKWSRFTNTDIFAGYGGGAVYVLMYVTGSFFAEAPMPYATVVFSEQQIDFSALAPMPYATVMLAEHISMRADATAPMPYAIARFGTNKTLTLLAGAPMPYAFVDTTEQSVSFAALAPMPYAFVDTTDVQLESVAEAPMPYAFLNLRQDTLSLLAGSPMPYAFVRTSEQQVEFLALAPMPDAIIDFASVTDMTLEALAPMPDAFITTGSEFTELVAFAPMPDAFITTEAEQGSGIIFFVIRKG